MASLLLIALSACGLGGPSGDGASPSPEAQSRPPSASPPGADESDPKAPPRDEPSSCAEVRAGIDAFNQGDLEETVSRFKDALPLAEAAAEEEPSRMADDLLEAVEYYAELPAEDYPAAVETPDFEKYKQITLSQCAGEGQMASPDEPELEV